VSQGVPRSFLEMRGDAMPVSRRRFVASSVAAALAAHFAPLVHGEGRAKPNADLAGKLGLTTGSFTRHLSVEAKPGKIRLLDVPALMRDELDLTVLDLMTATLASFEPQYLDDLRARAEKSGCTITNLKMNQKVDLTSADADERARALAEYRRTIDAAARLGCRWVRPIPGPKRPDLALLAAGYRELIEHAAPQGITLLVENFGWMTGDPDAVPQVVAAVGRGLAASVDTGNWTDAARWDGLARAFPLAVTCDFKAFPFEPDGTHPRYDLRRCFDAGWKAGFRGPWCFEHFDDTLPGLVKGFARLRDLLRAWQKESA
jgi:hypothetical protein